MRYPGLRAHLLIAGVAVIALSSCQSADAPPEGRAVVEGRYDPFTAADFVEIAPGSFMMGSDAPEAYPDERPVHRVTLSEPFYIGKTEVTRSQWQAVTGNDPGSFGDASHPVDMVSWNDIQSFLVSLNALAECDGCYRLPTEAEWEYAARAGSAPGDSAALLQDQAWYAENAGYMTQPVASKKPNAWGLYDMQGNVYEWVHDRYAPYAGTPVVDPRGPEQGQTHVIRGGSWTDGPREQRVTYRDYYAPDHRHDFFGFRLVRSSF